MLFTRHKTTMPTPEQALAGHASRPYAIGPNHAVLGTPIEGAPPAGFEEAVFALGCFWGAEQHFWQTPGVWTTAAGYTGGVSANPTYDEVCSGRTGQAEAVRVVYDPSKVTYMDLLKLFWESHDPTQGYRQGNDIGTQYRSAIYYTTEAQKDAAMVSRAAYQDKLRAAGYGDITTEIVPASDFYYAEDAHQQYLYKVPGGYCPDHSTGVSCPIGLLPAGE